MLILIKAKAKDMPFFIYIISTTYKLLDYNFESKWFNMKNFALTECNKNPDE